MPVYAGEFLSLVQTLLERTLERCRAVFTEAVLGSLSSGLIGRSDIEGLMKQQTSILLIDQPPSQLSIADVELAGEEPQPDSEAYELEQQLQEALWRVRPVREEQLLSDPHRLLLLAALSDTLEHLADAITL